LKIDGDNYVGITFNLVRSQIGLHWFAHGLLAPLPFFLCCGCGCKALLAGLVASQPQHLNYLYV
jgi:hypothetical protein